MPSPDRRVAWIVFLITFACYSYFFQGIGWNQMAHFATIRSLAEHGSAEISRFTDLTQDITVTPHGTFSTKSPGFALLGTPAYFLLIKVERLFSIDIDARPIWLINMHAITILLCSLPSAWLNVQIFFAFRRASAPLRAAILLTGAFAFGSLSWPYSGVLMVHTLSAAFVFAAWYQLTQPTLTSKNILAAGALIGLGIFCDILVAPVAAVLAIYLIARKTPLRNWIFYCIGPCAAVLLTLLYNRLAHGSAFASGPFHPIAPFTAPNLLFGEFGWPEWIRLYWITYHPMRGLFACCPLFMIPILTLFLVRLPLRITLNQITILLILATYIIFYLTFIGWTGGWSVGTRYLIPALPLVWLFALKPFQRFPKISAILIAISIFNMLAVTSVRVIYPGPSSGEPNQSDPVRGDAIVFIQGHTNRSEEGHNLASLAHIPEKLQLLPIFALLIAYYAYAFTRPRHASTSGGTF